jgi:hypothetical protein
MKGFIWLSGLVLIGLAISWLAGIPTWASSPFDRDFCTYNGKPLYGKVQFVENFADIQVQVVTAFSDLNVKLVSSFADECGEWQLVESFPDFKIKMVESFPDLKIQFVESFPGVSQ